MTGTAYIALGANLGNRLRTLRQAVERLRILGTVDAISPVYETEPVGYLEQPPYLNAVVRLQTPLDASGLLGALLAGEKAEAATLSQTASGGFGALRGGDEPVPAP